MSVSENGALVRQVEFISQDAILRGRLYLPGGADIFPTIVMAHGFTSTINGMTADKYAEKFQRAGFCGVVI